MFPNRRRRAITAPEEILRPAASGCENVGTEILYPGVNHQRDDGRARSEAPANLDRGDLAETSVGGSDTPDNQESDDDPVVSEELPEHFALDQNQPNPFDPRTEISYSLVRGSHVRLELFNIIGHLVATLVDQDQEAGRHTATWDGGNLASGIYLYRISTSDFNAARKMILLK